MAKKNGSAKVEESNVATINEENDMQNAEENTNVAETTTTTTTTVETTIVPAAESTEKTVRKMTPRPVQEPYVVDVDNINSAFAGKFTAQLASAIDELQSDSSTEVPMVVLRTTYIPVGSVIEREQYWAVVMGSGYPEDFSVYDVLRPDSDAPDVDKLLEVLGQFKNVGINNLHYLPLMSDRINPIVPLYSQVRGSANDKSPFVIHTKNVSRVCGSIENNEWKFQSLDGGVITPHQQKLFTNWFAKQLTEQTTEDIMLYIFKSSAISFLRRATDTSMIRKQLDAIDEVVKANL